MPKGPLITDKVKQLIAEVYLQHRDWRAKEVQYEVAHRMNGNGPGLSTVQKELTKIRRKDAERSLESKGLDRPWSIGTLLDCSIPPEVIPILIRLQAESRKDGKLLLTVREARWIARLYLIPTVSELVNSLDAIKALAMTYANREKISELCNQVLDTSDLDDALNTGEIMSLVFQMIRDFYKLPRKTLEGADQRVLQLVQKVHQHLELAMDMPDFVTLPGYLEYAMWLGHISSFEKSWPTLSKEKQRQIVTSLQNWVRQNEPDFSYKFPTMLKLFWRSKDERPHSQTVQG